MQEEELLKLSELERALALAVYHHRGAQDKGGEPYILHVLRVMMLVDTKAEKTAALLHDLLEDSEVKEEDLLKLQFSPSIVKSVVLLTRTKEEEYEEYIRRVAENPISRNVKLADLSDNQRKERLPVPLQMKDILRLEKYRAAEAYLKALEKEEETKNER